MKLFTIVTISALALAGCKDKATTEAAPTTSVDKPIERAAATPPATPSPPYKSADGRYTQRVTYGEPIEKELPDPNGAGDWKTAEWKSGTSMFIVQYIDYADHATAVAEVAGFIPTRDSSKVASDKPAKFGTREGREIEMAVNTRTTMWMRFVIEGKRVYKIVAATRSDRASATAFLDGFSVGGA